MKKNIIAIFGISIGLFALSCKDSFLNITPTTSLVSEQLNNQGGVEGLLIGAYAELNGNTHGGGEFYAGVSNWLWGSVTGGDANKGSNSGDQADAGPFSRFEGTPTNSKLPSKWVSSYEGISRANQTLKALAAVSGVSDSDKKRISGEARFLRGFFHLELKKLWKNIPYIDETKDYGSGVDQVSNTIDAWPMIEADFKYAMDNLPETQTAVGRANKWAAASFLAKVYLYEGKFAEAKTLFTDVIANGKTTNGLKYALTPTFQAVFNGNNENNAESIFAFQAAANTGSVTNTSADMVLNYPYNGGPSGCCGFFQPSFDLANSFRVDAKGLPFLDNSYRLPTNELKTDQGLQTSASFTPDTKAVDPRLDHSVGRRGIPYLDWGPHPGNDWVRDQGYGGPYAPKKFVFSKAQKAAVVDGSSSWGAGGFTSINYPVMRYADLLLMAAEAEIEAGSLETARSYVNMVRSRAANSAGMVMNGSTPAANYLIKTYDDVWSDKAMARKAVRFERKLELSGEGHRFFDLVRWGIASEELNAFLAYEVTKLPSTYAGGKFVSNKNEYLPIPQSQIDVQKGVLKQNPGY